jgi:hypothetical protein
MGEHGKEILSLSFQPFESRNIFGSKEDHLLTVSFLMDLTGIESHYFVPYGRKIMLNFKITKMGAFRQNLLKQCPQRGNAPLSVPKVIDKLSPGFRLALL